MYSIQNDLGEIVVKINLQYPIKSHVQILGNKEDTRHYLD